MAEWPAVRSAFPSTTHDAATHWTAASTAVFTGVNPAGDAADTPRPIFWLGGRQREYPPQYYYVLSDIAEQYWLPSVRSASSRFHSAIRRHQFASVRWADSRLTRLVPPNLELALTLLNPNPVTGQKGKTRHPRGSDWTAYSNVAVHRMRLCSRDFRCRRSRSRCTRRCHSETCRRKVAQASLSFTDQHKWATSSFPLIIILIIINVLV